LYHKYIYFKKKKEGQELCSLSLERIEPTYIAEKNRKKEGCEGWSIIFTDNM